MVLLLPRGVYRPLPSLPGCHVSQVPSAVPSVLVQDLLAQPLLKINLLSCTREGGTPWEISGELLLLQTWNNSFQVQSRPEPRGGSWCHSSRDPPGFCGPIHPGGRLPFL